MFAVELFFGVAVDPDFQGLLNKANPHVVAMFVNNDSDYLHEVTCQGTRYLGKFVGNVAETSTLELLEANIRSLLMRLVSDCPEEHLSLVLVATPRNNDS